MVVLLSNRGDKSVLKKSMIFIDALNNADFPICPK